MSNLSVLLYVVADIWWGLRSTALHLLHLAVGERDIDRAEPPEEDSEGGEEEDVNPDEDVLEDEDDDSNWEDIEESNFDDPPLD